MKYHNPIIPGFFPDPSICTDGKKYYLVNSTFQFFPGVALFESENLIEWKQIGNVLTRKSQLPLTHAVRSAGIFAPVIRYHDGRFYMITTNVSDGGNFIVYTDDIYGEWSEPVWIEAGGIDPSLCFVDGKCYFTGNGLDEDGVQSVLQCEINPETGEMLTPLKGIYRGNGGRYLEGPHLYKIGDNYYIMAAEGGTEYGHMEIYAKSKNPYGPFENYKNNPVLTNRNLGGYVIQGCGHADLVQDNKTGEWWMVHLAFRQTGQYMMYHVTGRETYLMPVTFDEDGWFTVGESDQSGVTGKTSELEQPAESGQTGESRMTIESGQTGESEMTIESGQTWAADKTSSQGITTMVVKTNRLPDIKQKEELVRTFFNTTPGIEWMYQRNPDMCCYNWKNHELTLTGNDVSMNDSLGSSAFVAIRQEGMDGDVTCTLSDVTGEAGLTVYMDEMHHYDLAVIREGENLSIVYRLCVGDIRHEQQKLDIGKLENFGDFIEESDIRIRLLVHMEPQFYHFAVEIGDAKKDTGFKRVDLGKAQSRYLSTEVASGFTGVLFGLYAEPKGKGHFSDFEASYKLYL